MLEANPKDVFRLLSLEPYIQERVGLLSSFAVKLHHRLLVDESRHLFREGLELLLTAKPEDEEGRRLRPNGRRDRLPFLR